MSLIAAIGLVSEMNLWIVIGISVLVIAIVVVILFNRMKTSTSTTTDADLRMKYENLINSFIVPQAAMNRSEMGWMQNFAAHFFQDFYISNKREREIFLESILSLHKSLSGDMREQLRALYLQVDLKSISVEKLKSPHWELKIKGIRELAQMHVKESYPFLQQLAQHPNETVAMEAQLAMISLNEEESLNFLMTLRHPLSEWHQMHLFTMFKDRPVKKLPDFTVWLASHNDSVVMFALKMIRYFNQYESSMAIIRLLRHPSEEVRREVFSLLSEMQEMTSSSLLLDVYENADDQLKTEILLNLDSITGTLGNPTFDIEIKPVDFGQKMAMAKALASRGLITMISLKSTNGSSDKQLDLMIKNALKISE